MKISLNWLSQYIDLAGLSVDEMSDMLTFAGIEVEDIRQQGVDSPLVVVARVASAEQHPQADRLKVCQVDVGDGTLHQIVCGAQNYKAGDKVPCSLPGAVLPGNVEIKWGKLRGVESRGMHVFRLRAGAAGQGARPLDTAAGAGSGHAHLPGRESGYHRGSGSDAQPSGPALPQRHGL